MKYCNVMKLRRILNQNIRVTWWNKEMCHHLTWEFMSAILFSYASELSRRIAQCSPIWKVFFTNQQCNIRQQSTEINPKGSYCERYDHLRKRNYSLSEFYITRKCDQLCNFQRILSPGSFQTIQNNCMRFQELSWIQNCGMIARGQSSVRVAERTCPTFETHQALQLLQWRNRRSCQSQVFFSRFPELNQKIRAPKYEKSQKHNITL